MKQLIGTIERLRVSGICFCSLTESIDTTTAQGVLAFRVFNAFAEFERDLINEQATDANPADCSSPTFQNDYGSWASRYPVRSFRRSLRIHPRGRSPFA